MDREGTKILSSRIRKLLRNTHCTYGDHHISVSLSIGAAILDEKMGADEFFEAADLDMLCEKAGKHGRI